MLAMILNQPFFRGTKVANGAALNDYNVEDVPLELFLSFDLISTLTM